MPSMVWAMGIIIVSQLCDGYDIIFQKHHSLFLVGAHNIIWASSLNINVSQTNQWYCSFITHVEKCNCCWLVPLHWLSKQISSIISSTGFLFTMVWDEKNLAPQHQERGGIHSRSLKTDMPSSNSGVLKFKMVPLRVSLHTIYYFRSIIPQLLHDVWLFVFALISALPFWHFDTIYTHQIMEQLLLGIHIAMVRVLLRKNSYSNTWRE